MANPFKVETPALRIPNSDNMAINHSTNRYVALYCGGGAQSVTQFFCVGSELAVTEMNVAVLDIRVGPNAA